MTAGIGSSPTINWICGRKWIDVKFIYYYYNVKSKSYPDLNTLVNVTRTNM